MSRFERKDESVEIEAFIRDNPELAREMGMVTARQVIIDSEKAKDEVRRIAEADEGHGDGGVGVTDQIDTLIRTETTENPM